jgi:hypothetical protein
MDKVELRDGINRILFHVLSNEERADKIAELIAPILADAESWRKVKEIADSCFCPMQECPLYKRCIDLPCLAELVVDALDGKEEG